MMYPSCQALKISAAPGDDDGIILQAPSFGKSRVALQVFERVLTFGPVASIVGLYPYFILDNC